MLVGLLMVLMIIAVLYFTDVLSQKEPEKPLPQEYIETKAQAEKEIKGIEDRIRAKQGDIDK